MHQPCVGICGCFWFYCTFIVVLVPLQLNSADALLIDASQRDRLCYIKRRAYEKITPSSRLCFRLYWVPLCAAKVKRHSILS